MKMLNENNLSLGAKEPVSQHLYIVLVQACGNVQGNEDASCKYPRVMKDEG